MQQKMASKEGMKSVADAAFLDAIKSTKSTDELIQFGIINIDKPSGPTSFSVDEFLKKTFGLKKASHFGTLDPKVTGVLPIALNRACKLTGFFIGEDKTYVGIMKFHESVDREALDKAMKEVFTGIITQLPPVRSRVKRAERQRLIRRFDILEEREGHEGQEFIFLTECEGGTYIRKLIHDLGEHLGIGAHMLELRRIRAGIFDEMGSGVLPYPVVKLQELEAAVAAYIKGNDTLLRAILIPGEVVSFLYPQLFVSEKSVSRLLTGKALTQDDVVDKVDVTAYPAGTLITLFSEKGKQFIEVARVVHEGDIFAKPEFVLTRI